MPTDKRLYNPKMVKNLAAKRAANQAVVKVRKAERQLSKPSKTNALMGGSEWRPKPGTPMPMPGPYLRPQDSYAKPDLFTTPVKPREKRVKPPGYRT